MSGTASSRPHTPSECSATTSTVSTSSGCSCGEQGVGGIGEVGRDSTQGVGGRGEVGCDTARIASQQARPMRGLRQGGRRREHRAPTAWACVYSAHLQVRGVDGWVEAVRLDEVNPRDHEDDQRQLRAVGSEQRLAWLVRAGRRADPTLGLGRHQLRDAHMHQPLHASETAAPL